VRNQHYRKAIGVANAATPDAANKSLMAIEPFDGITPNTLSWAGTSLAL
jgi:hypothetical protein